MTELAFMVREDWAQHGTAMVQQSARIRQWLTDSSLFFATTDVKKFGASNSADREFVEYLGAGTAAPKVITFGDLRELRRDGDAIDAAVVALHPFKDQDCETLREVIDAGRLAKVFGIIWAPSDLARTMFEGLGATNLHTGSTVPSSDPVQLEAAKCVVREQSKGLASGYGKDAVVQLLRVFTAAGYPLDRETWLRAFFAAGGEFDEAEKVGKLISEMQAGVRHRVKARYRPARSVPLTRDRDSAQARSREAPPRSCRPHADPNHRDSTTPPRA